MKTNRIRIPETRKALLLVVLILLIPSVSLSMQSDTVGGVLSVDVNAVVGEISPFVYGANYGPHSAVTVDLFEVAENAGLTFLRFPGGRMCWDG
jgi:hypothetical protein